MLNEDDLDVDAKEILNEVLKARDVTLVM